MKKMLQNKIIAWLRGLVWAAMVAGCAWAGAQSYLVQPATGHYRVIALGQGEGVGVGHGIGAEGAQSTQPLPKDDLFAGTEVFAKGATDITEITMDPDTLSMVGGPDEHRARNTVLKVVRTYTYDKPGMYNMSDVDAIRNKLNTGEWHCSVHVRDLKNGSGTDVCGKRRTDGMKESAIIEVEPKQLTFIHTISKGNGPGSSELGFFPMLHGLSPTAMIAMTDPEALADMAIGLHGMPMMLNLEPGLTLQMRDLQVHPFNQEQMKELQDNLKTLKVRPFDQEQMNRLNDQMKEFNRDFYKDKEKTVPTPQVAPTPETPQTAPLPQPPQ